MIFHINLVVFTFWILCGGNIGGVFCISVDNGRYEDVNIVIQDSVEENDALLERIKDVFTRTSKMLFEATRHHVYFGQINIILPRSWTLKPEFKAVAARSDLESYITVETGKVKVPHTKRKQKKCGHAGRYIYLHRDFLLQEGKTKWGYHENVLVHEWGHLRWGLFDEYTKKTTKSFYLDDGVWNPSRCSKQVKGTLGIGSRCRSSTSCKVSDTTRVMSKNCKFCPDETQSVSNMSSIMAYNWVDGISMFCDKEDDETVPLRQRHNSKAPTQQNAKCKGRSAWEVMREHVDFNSDPLPATTDSTPVFNILRETDGYRVFVLDVSGSMDTDQRIRTLYQASEYVIQNRIPEDSWLGIVWFSTTASTKMSLTQIISQKVRDSLVAALPLTTGGKTCIGCGIEIALQIFKQRLTDLTGCEIIVISDGGNNVGYLNSSVQHAAKESVTIHTISITQQADLRMISMAKSTGGIHISYLETGTISFASLFLELVSSGITEKPSITLVSETVDTSTSSPFTFTFDVDNSIGYNTTVSVLQKVSTSIEIKVESPDGTLYSQQTIGKTLVLDIPGIAGPGQYNVSVEARTPFEYFVISNPSGPEVVRVVSWISPTDFNYASGELPVVEADVMKGEAAVLNASVTAVLETGNSDPCNVSLLDDGVDPDDTAGDGVYAAVIPRFCINSNGRVTAKVYARAESGAASVHDPFNAGAGFPDSDEDSESPEVLEDSFQRVSLRNEILVTYFSSALSAKDITPPGRITDVDVIDIYTENTKYGESRNFTITWTSTGDDINIGQATNYELRIADDIYTLINNFSGATLLDVVNANYTPKASGKTEYIRLEINAEESYTSTTFFAVRALDEAGNAGDVSNVVSILVAKGYRIKVEGDVDFQFSPVEDSVVEEKEKTDLTTLAIGLSCAAAVLVIVITAVVVFVKKFKSKDCEHGGTFSNAAVSFENPMNDI